MAKVKFILDLTTDEKDAVRANLHVLDRNCKLYKKLNTMTTKQKISITETEYTTIENLFLSALNNESRYPSKEGKEYKAIQTSLTKLRASVYE